MRKVAFFPCILLTTYNIVPRAIIICVDLHSFVLDGAQPSFITFKIALATYYLQRRPSETSLMARTYVEQQPGRKLFVINSEGEGLENILLFP